MVRCYIGLGSNLNNPKQQILDAIEALRQVEASQLVCVSSLYRSPPMGPQDQPHYINAVAALDTHLEPLALLSQLQLIEQLHGRVRKAERWGARTLDLDLLLYGDQVLERDNLIVPHSGLTQRNFVLIPLFEIAPELQLPKFGPLKALMAGCERGDLVKLERIL
ncbi:2-amino-4-hydroxy-6-hydroxymethyldihydropteridine diphosphokinase [Kaarinaea lacus]